MTRQCDLLIRDGSFALPGGVAHGMSMAIQGDRIEAIGTADALPPGREEIDATGRYVVPGFIDAHIHTRDPGNTEKDEIYPITVAGAISGVTTMLAMFNVNPMVCDETSYRNFIEYASTRSMINFNINAALTDGHIEDVAKLATAGVPSFKMVLGYKFDVSGGKGRWESRAVQAPDDGVLLHAMSVLAEHDIPLVAHAENDDIIRWHQDDLRARGEVGRAAHLKSRPSVAEVEAISRLILFSRATGCHVHILHLGNGEGVRLVREAQHQGVKVTAETCPHFLLMTNDDMVRLGGVAKTNPPIRTQWDQDELWKAIEQGGLDTIGTDHAPHTDEQKLVDGNIFDVFAGWPGIETGPPLMFTQVNKGRLSISRLVEMYSTKPAQLFGLYPERGVLQPGSIADVVVVDLEAEATIEGAKLHSKAKHTPFESWKVQGLPTHTIVNGKIVYREGEVLGRPGEGRWVPSRRANPDLGAGSSWDQ